MNSSTRDWARAQAAQQRAFDLERQRDPESLGRLHAQRRLALIVRSLRISSYRTSFDGRTGSAL